VRMVCARPRRLLLLACHVSQTPGICLKTLMRTLFHGALAIASIGSVALAPARAQEISPQSLLNERYQQFLEQGLKAGSEERACDDTWKVVGEFLKVAQEIERQRTAVTGHVRFGFNGDEAGIER